MMTFVIDMMDNYSIANTDIFGTFLQTNMEGTVWVQLYGVLSEMLLKINPKQYKYKVVIERGKKVIYVVLKHALYRALISSPLS